jgi:penicillin-binding protein 1A
VVRTALDPALQARAESSIENTLRQYGQQYDVKQASMALIEPQGAVRAMVGGRDYGASQFNRASDALRQPGSSFKVYVYTTAMLNGYTPKSVVLDGPITIGNWSPHNYSNRYHGRVQLITALTHSYNTVPVRLGRAVGLDKVIDTAVRMGVRTPLRLNRALALGTSEVTVLDQATGYNTLANGGYRTVPYAVLDVRNSNGTLLWRHDRDGTQPERVLSPQIVAEMNQMLVNVVENGTGRRAQLPGIRVGGKTGTSQDYRDGWFIGFTGDFTCAVWFGNDDYTGTRKMTGGTLPAMVWHDVMSLAESGVDPKPIPGVAPVSGGAARVADATGPPTSEPAGDRLSRRAVSVLNDIEAMMRRAAGESLTEATPAKDTPVATPAGFRKQARTGPENSAGSDPAVAVR